MNVKATKPPVAWDGESYTICLPYPADEPKQEWMEVLVKPRLTYVVRIREVGEEEWLIGIKTPLTSCHLIELKPETDYEMEVRAKNAAGEGEPAIVRCRTGPDGSLNRIPMTSA